MTDDEYLAHIESAILEIGTHTAGMTQEAYEADSKTQRAVEETLGLRRSSAGRVRRLANIRDGNRSSR